MSRRFLGGLPGRRRQHGVDNLDFWIVMGSKMVGLARKIFGGSSCATASITVAESDVSS